MITIKNTNKIALYEAKVVTEVIYDAITNSIHVTVPRPPALLKEDQISYFVMENGLGVVLLER